LVLDHGGLPYVLALLADREWPHVRFEASWVLSNIAAGTSAHCQAIVDKGGVELLLELLNESHFRLNEQAIWAIGNIGGDTIKLRDLIIKKNGLEVLIKLAEKSTHKCIIKRAAWAISNLCRGTPLPKFDLIKNGVATLAKIVISQVLDDDELSDCLWAISSNSNEGQKSRIQKLV
jgi:importin subunit alpha-6/7